MNIVMNYDDQNSRGMEAQARVTLSFQELEQLKSGATLSLVHLIGGSENDEMPVKVIISLDTN